MAGNLPRCPDRDCLYAFKVGNLPDEVHEQVVQHLSACDRCGMILDELDDAAEPLVQWENAALAEWARAEEEPGNELIPHNLPAGYVAIEKVGQGGMGVVIRAKQVLLGRDVAIKFLPRTWAVSPRTMRRFREEIIAAGSLDHPNLVRAYEAREVDGVPFLVLEYIDGKNLKKLVETVRSLGTADACEMIRQAAEGMQSAHEKCELVHRDIKPSNLMLTPKGCIKVVDLGLARLIRPRPIRGTSTGQGLMGTPDFMAPEQAEDASAADIRADIYSLGCTLYHLLAGKPPFAGSAYKSDAQKIAGHARDAAPPIRPEIPVGLAAILERMMAKRPEDRFQIPAEVAQALQPFTVGHNLPALFDKQPLPPDDPPITVKHDVPGPPVLPENWTRRLIQAIRRNPIRATLLGLALPIALVVAVAAGLNLFFSPPPPTNVSVWATLLVNPPPPWRQPIPGLIQAKQGKPFDTLERREARALVVSPDGKLLIVAEVERAPLNTVVRIFAVEEEEELARLAFDGDNVWTLAISPDGNWLAAPCWTNSRAQHIQVWRRDANWEGVQMGKGTHADYITSLTFTSDSKKLIAGSGDNTASVWDVELREKLFHLDRYRERKMMDFHSLAICPPHGSRGELVAVGNSCGEVLIFDTEDFKTLADFQAHGTASGTHRIMGLTFSPDGETLISSDSDNEPTVKIWNVANLLQNQHPALAARTLSMDSPGKRLALSPNGRFLALGGTNHDVGVGSVEKGSKIPLSAKIEIYGNLQFFPDGKTLAVVGPNGAQLWHLTNLPGAD